MLLQCGAWSAWRRRSQYWYYGDNDDDDADGGDDDEAKITVWYQGGRSRQVTVECCRMMFSSSEEKSDRENSLKKSLLFLKNRWNNIEWEAYDCRMQHAYLVQGKNSLLWIYLLKKQHISKRTIIHFKSSVGGWQWWGWQRKTLEWSDCPGMALNARFYHTAVDSFQIGLTIHLSITIIIIVLIIKIEGTTKAY